MQESNRNLTPNELIRLKGVVKDISDLLSKIELYRASINDAKKALKDELELSSSDINLLVKLYHSDKASEYFDDQSELESLFDSMVHVNEGTQAND